MSQWDAWIGREEQREDRIDWSLAMRWLATFNRVPPGDGTLPQGIHWCLCTPDAPTNALGEDGHPLRNERPSGFLPPVPLPRRMWASSRVEFLRSLRADQQIARLSRVHSVTEKQGGSGPLVFVEVDHETTADGELAVRERQSLVYRAAAPADAPLVPPEPGPGRFDPAGWSAYRTLVPDEALLFRYSALTFNSHRIHYDLPYARDIERYRGLVVHGPLTASLLLDTARVELGDNAISEFTFRGLSPAICGEELILATNSNRDDFKLGAFAADGRHIASASVKL